MRPNACIVALFGGLALAATSTVAQAESRPKSEELARARALDKEGAKAYGEGRYNDAIRYFEEAYRLGGPAFELWNVAKCYLRLDQPERAAEMLERYLSLPNLPKEDRQEATKQLEALKKRPSTLTVSSTPSGAQVSLDGKKLGDKTPLSVTIPPGTHTVTVASGSREPYTQQIEARYGRAVIVDASLPAHPALPAQSSAPPSAASEHEAAESVVTEKRPPPPANPYVEESGAAIALRGAIGIAVPRWGSVGGKIGPSFHALGSVRVTQVGDVAISAGGLVAIAGDAWGNRTGALDEATGCVAPLRDAHGATALSFFGIGTASLPLSPKVRAVGIGGLGLAAYAVGNVGGDVFVPSCRPSPGVRPAVLFGAAIDYAITSRVRLSALPITWQIQPAFAGVRAAPRDASGVWMRFGIGVGAGVDF